MKRALLLCIGLATLAGCGPFGTAPYLDREFGEDSRAAWDAQIINKENRYADVVPTGQRGITSEEVMDVKNKAFAERQRSSQVFEFNMGQ